MCGRKIAPIPLGCSRENNSDEMGCVRVTNGENAVLSTVFDLRDEETMENGRNATPTPGTLTDQSP